jgi:hypothetical protein
VAKHVAAECAGMETEFQHHGLHHRRLLNLHSNIACDEQKNALEIIFVKENL